jgi:hypothetical protein
MVFHSTGILIKRGTAIIMPLDEAFSGTANI